MCVFLMASFSVEINPKELLRLWHQLSLVIHLHFHTMSTELSLWQEKQVLLLVSDSHGFFRITTKIVITTIKQKKSTM